jgi:DDE superfamily endonuclease
LTKIFCVLYSLQGRATFENMSRYCSMDEKTFRLNYSKFFDWARFNFYLFTLWGHTAGGAIVAALDCSFIDKSGKHTYGLDRFWSGVLQKTKKGLEVSVIALIDAACGWAWALDVTQTPPGLSSKEEGGYTRVDFYLEQFLDCLPYLRAVVYVVADGFYAKAKVINVLTECGKHLITKLRPDANLLHPFEGEHPKGKPGPKPQFGSKALFSDLSKWIHIGPDEKYPYLEIYSQILWAPQFKCWLRVVFVLNTKTKKYILLACTDICATARQVLAYYQLRFQIEFLFRDAKQFTGLTHCQARDEQKLDFHFNLSLAAINLAQVQRKLNPAVKSMNDLTRRAFNQKLIENLFSELSAEAKFDLLHPAVLKTLDFGIIHRE